MFTTNYKTVLRTFVLLGVVMVLCSIKMLRLHTNSGVIIADSNLHNIVVGDSTSSLSDTTLKILLDTTRKTVVQNDIEKNEIFTANSLNSVNKNEVNYNLTWVKYVSFNDIKSSGICAL